MASKNQTVILVTGGNSGIGYETVLALAQYSADYHIILAARSLEKGQKALDEIKSSHGETLKGDISLIRIDVTDAESMRTAQQEVESKFGHLDVLLSNAGIIVYQSTDTLIDYRKTFETNLFGPALLSEIFDPLLRKSSRPMLIHVSSEQGSIGLRLDPTYKWASVRGDNYRTSKAALNMLAACQRYSFAEWGCKVAAFNPGFCVTNLTGDEGKKMRTRLGADGPDLPAKALVDIISGKRDEDFQKNAMLDVKGVISTW